MKKFALILAGIIVATGSWVIIVHAVETSYVPLAPLPFGVGGAESQTYTLSTYLGGMLKLLIALGAGISILVAIVGGVQYVAAGIAPSAKQDAKERITNSLIGLALVLTSYLILNSINPNLVRFEFFLPPVGTTPIQQYKELEGGSVSPLCPNPNDASSACCPPGVACTACLSCSTVASYGVTNKGCGAGYTCFLNSTLLSRLKNVSGVTGWRITESWPPTVTHKSSCHQNGTCADLNNSGGSTDPANIKKYYDAFKAAGLDVLYESTNCAPYIEVGVTNCKTYSTMTNHSSFHVK